jgi:hypothetical protein
MPSDYRIVVIVDEDRQDCLDIKGRLEEAAQQAGLVTRSTGEQPGGFQVLNRIAIEELEAWFFGDPEAIKAAYRRYLQPSDQRASTGSQTPLPAARGKPLRDYSRKRATTLGAWQSGKLQGTSHCTCNPNVTPPRAFKC